MLAILTDSKPAISAIRKLDKGLAQPRSGIEARILEDLCKKIDKDTCVAWVKNHKGIKGKEEADRLCRQTSILGHEAEGVVTPAGLRAWSKHVRAEAREEERGYWDGTARQYQPTPGVSRRKGHNGGGSTKLGKKRCRYQ